MAINLSARQLDTPGLVDTVRSALDDFGADPGDITFEITETVVLHDVETVVDTLDGLKGLGVRLSLDDFGTGYSSLTYLTRPIDSVRSTAASSPSSARRPVARRSWRWWSPWPGPSSSTSSPRAWNGGAGRGAPQLGLPVCPGYLFAPPRPVDEP